MRKPRFIHNKVDELAKSNLKEKRKQKKKSRDKQAELPYVSAELLERAKAFRPQKSLGQCFMVDDWLLDEIIELAEVDPEKDLVLEIGPGIGFLTERLVKKCKHLYAVDIDNSISKAMKIIKASNDNFTFKRQDILRTNLADLTAYDPNSSDPQYNKLEEHKLKIIANIPYQISTQILLHFFGEIAEASENKQFVDEMYILVQREFAQRVVAKPGEKAYGALSILMQYWADVEFLVEVEPSSFYPQPKVHSAYIKITPLKEPRVKLEKPQRLRRFAKAVFANRRKKLSNGLKSAGYNQDLIKELDLGNTRGETLSLEDMVKIIEKLDPVG